MRIPKIEKVARNLGRHVLANLRELFGAKEKYCIRGAYVHRAAYCYFDDTEFRDEYQKEVYLRAADIARNEKLLTAYDVGCGSGFKLVHYLGQYRTVGFDVPETVAFLSRKYPDRKWASVSFADRSWTPADIVICSDVIEHVLDPDQLMSFLASVTKKWLVISTPDRRREYPLFSPFQLGPPHTDHHIREWSFKEFRRYVDPYVDVIEHCHPHPTHATQMIVATARS